MTKAELMDTTFENFISNYTNYRNQAGGYFLKTAEVIAEAKNKMKPKMFKKFLNDPRINLKRLQADKLITIYEFAKSDSRLTHFFNREGVEKAYLITTIKDNETRNQFIEAVENDTFTVKQTKRAVLLIKEDNKHPKQAIQEIKNLPKAIPVKQERKTVSIEEYNTLHTKYEKILKEKQELENKLKLHMPVESKSEDPKETSQELKTPVDSDEPEGTLDKVRRSIVAYGKELPIPQGINIEEKSIDLLKMAAINNAKNNHKLDLP